MKMQDQVSCNQSESVKPVVMSVSDLHFSYGKKQVLSGVTFELSKAESVLFLGQNGAGKTTLLSCLVGMLFPSKGTITKDVRANMSGFVGEIPFIPDANAWVHFELELIARGKGRRCVWEEKALNLAEALALDRKDIEKPVGKCSTGTRKKIAIIQALLCEPKLLILDEPTSGLDPASIVRFREILHTIQKQTAMTILLSSHQLAESRKIADRAIVLHRGRISANLSLDGRIESEWQANFARTLDQNESKILHSINGFKLINQSIDSSQFNFLLIDPAEIVLSRLVEAKLPVKSFLPAEDRLEKEYLKVIHDVEI